jgi:hypothetical protein
VAAAAGKAVAFNNAAATSLAASTGGQKIGALITARLGRQLLGKWHLHGRSGRRHLHASPSARRESHRRKQMKTRFDAWSQLADRARALRPRSAFAARRARLRPHQGLQGLALADPVIMGTAYTDSDFVRQLSPAGILDRAGGFLNRAPVAKTANYQILSPLGNGRRVRHLFTTRGAGGAVTFTLPAISRPWRALV